MHPASPVRRDIRLIAVFASLLLGCVIWVGSSAAADRLSETSGNSTLVVRIYYDEIADLDRLDSYDVWEFNDLQKGYVLAAVNDAGYTALITSGWQVAIDQEASVQINRRERRFGEFFGGYRTVVELYADLEAMNQAAPNLSELVQYGHSHCLDRGGCVTPGGDALPGFPLLALRVTNENVPGSSIIDGEKITMGSKPVFFLMANIHAREITTPEIAMRFLGYLLDSYGDDADASWLVDHHEIWVVPTTNPDGHWLVELGERPEYGGRPFLQRKNANNDVNHDGNPDCSVWPPNNAAQLGIDLNRNHSFRWSLIGASNQPCDLVYHGPSAASESETAALEALITALIPDQRGPDLKDPAPDETTGIFISLHSYSNLVLWPWGDQDKPAPNKQGLQAIGDKLASFNGYQSCQSGSCLYRTSGATDDWTYGELGIPSFTFEIGDEFQPPFTIIESTQWPENKPALIYAAKIARTPYVTARGPMISQPIATQAGDRLTIATTAADRPSYSRWIDEVIATIDTPPWVKGAEKIALAPIDGAFDSPLEAALGTISLTELAPGRHMLFVQGQAQTGEWGEVSAIFFDNPFIERLYMPLSVAE